MNRLIAACLLLTTATTAFAAPSAIERYFEGLRQRGMFDLAEGEALRRLGSDPPPESRARLVAELARTFVEHAKYAEGREQADLWKRADAAVADFLEADPTSPSRVRLDVLRGELALARGETLRWLAELSSGNFASQAEAALAEAVEQLTAVEAELNKRLRTRLRVRSASVDPIDAIELDELLARTRLKLGTAELERARLASGTARADRLGQTERWLAGLAKGAAAEEATWRSQILLAEAARLEGKPDVVRRRLAELQPGTLPDAAKDAIATVSTKLLLDEQKPGRAVAFLIDYRRTRGSLTGELRLLQIRGLADAAAAVEALGNEQEAAALRAEIPTVVGWTQAEHGGYWAYRARLAARNAERSARYGPKVAALVRQAEASLAAGQADAAVSTYAEAVRQAQGMPDVAVELASARASLLLKAGRYDEAAALLTSLVEQHSDLPTADELHLLSAYALGRLHDADPSSERREAYIARLEEHRTRFADSPTAAEATLRLASFYEQRRQYSKAIPLFKSIAGDAERGPVAAAAAARNYEHLLRHLRSARNTAATAEAATVRDRQLAEWTRAAVRDVTELTKPLRSTNPPSRPMTATEAELALRASRLLLSDADGQAEAATLLDRLASAFLIEHAATEQEFWEAARRSALPLRIVSLATRSRFDDASRLIDSLESAPVGDLLAVVRGLSELTEFDPRGQLPVAFGASDGPVGPRLTDLRRTATELLSERRSELSIDEARQLDVVLAKANLADGRSSAAVDRYDAALAERPNDKALLMQAAAALQASGDAKAVRKALDYWRRLEDQEPAGSEPWLAARLHVIEAHLAIGETTAARKLLTVTKLLHPKLGGGETKAAYEAVEQRLDAPTATNRGVETR
ncbi:MAG: tetratricopeptide repeat protein [Planctomycetaceae bacterium]